ncbi:DEAD/DEAH box helicase family protein [Leptolyngbya sp. AS-A5]|nr:DEAD/DEAH box helicase family protein [Leptolyngbya sp. FACHB-17]
MRKIAEDRKRQTEEELAAAKAEVSARKAIVEAVVDPHDFNEAQTRSNLIDVELLKAGWNINQPQWTEYEVQGMRTPTGKGYVDYVLWGDDGKPLALVEAKRTTKDARDGKPQAELYANCLEVQFGQRPIIFYSNGYQHCIWDDRRYPPRDIHSFLKKDELERLIFRRTNRKRLHLVQINPAIVERSYQTEAIRRITEAFDQKNSRKALLVMATGTGKTRTAIALVDLLIRANWVKRVLFLADRNTLLTQALRAFKTHLPTVTPIDLTKDKNIEGSNVILSTYPTMLNFINGSSDRVIGSGYFDLVIVDEAHRSIYKKYSALFDYFDALLVGLTATPRAEVHRDTYRIFELEKGNPTFAYELEDATKDGYLVPAKGLDVPFKFLRRGIRYADLSPEEKEEYEERFRYAETGAIPDQVNAAALNKWLFNINTVDQVLELLMRRGLKVEGGDRLGKTIIFARSQKHAQFIVDRFDANYPHYKGKFAQVIHSDISYAENLIDDFSIAVKQPTIAVSVDMLDTGVDVPEVVNLVFFKPVYSRVKFNQMIGRGTRLCSNLFGVDEHKTEFLVFDLCGNFDFFEQTIPETNQKPPETLTTRLVNTRLELAQLLNQQKNSDPEQIELRSCLLNDLHQHVATMERENFLVRRHLQQVEEFSNRERWEQLSEADAETISQSLSSLPNGLPTEDRLAKEFDLLCFRLQLSILKRTNGFVRLRDQVRDLLSQLEAKREIPMVKDQLSLIEEVQAEDWWTDVTPWIIDYVRLHLRDLIKFIDRREQRIVYTNFEDQMGEVQEVNVPNQQTGFSPYQYRKKVEAYIRANENHVAIAKLKRNAPLTESDLESLEIMLFSSAEVGSREQFEKVFGENLSLKLFIRQLVGLDRNAAKQAFVQYLEGSTFSANQIRFIETIIDYLTQNGVMDPGQLYEPPFTEAHPDGLDGMFRDATADQIVVIVRSFNETVEAEFRTAS